ncbi:MAG: hypothetical protein HKN26_09500 [Acidimicrobiales bacterium]|nr:hypothetical protein [Acidimicrobiales bacterium]
MKDDNERLRRRYERERTARLEAERIAERGMRDLYVANQELDRLVATRTSELDHARREAVRMGESQAFFLRSLSRQVRAPLNGVLGMLELLEAELDDPQHGLWVRSASASARDLLQLVTRLVLFVELEEDPPAAAEVEVGPIVNRLRADWTRVAMAEGTLLLVDDHTPPLTMVEAPTGRLEQFIALAVDNAVLLTGASFVRVDVHFDALEPSENAASSATGRRGDLRIRVAGDGGVDDAQSDGFDLVQTIAMVLVDQLGGHLNHRSEADDWFFELVLEAKARVADPATSAAE